MDRSLLLPLAVICHWFIGLAIIRVVSSLVHHIHVMTDGRRVEWEILTAFSGWLRWLIVLQRRPAMIDLLTAACHSLLSPLICSTNESCSSQKHGSNFCSVHDPMIHCWHYHVPSITFTYVDAHRETLSAESRFGCCRLSKLSGCPVSNQVFSDGLSSQRSWWMFPAKVLAQRHQQSQ